MRYLSSLGLLLCTAIFPSLLQAQSLRPGEMVREMAEASGFQQQYALFAAPKSTEPVAELADVGADYELLSLKASSLADIHREAPEALELDLPGQLGQARLVRADLFAEGFTVRETGGALPEYDLGLHYRGVLAGDEQSLVAISFFDASVSATIATDAGTFILGQLRSKTRTEHVLYNDRDLPVTDLGTCATEDSNLPYSPKELLDLDPQEKDANNCVNVYLEVDKSIYDVRGAGTTSFITGLFNQVAVLYANENLNIKISEILIWSTTDPYNSGTSGGNLEAFMANRTSFNGNLAHLLSFQASGGVAYVNVLCSPSFAYGFSSINNSFSTVPSYSWSVNVFAHELGHNFGSQHTHACVWNGNGTAIDGCYGTEGGCGSSVGLPSGGGTVMSYCHLTSVGVNFNKGFGEQPGNLMRNRAYNGPCLSACSDGGGGGGDGGGGGGGGEEPDCSVINFVEYPPSSYGGGQDAGTFDLPNSERINLRGNAWKDINFDYVVTANTVMSFDFGVVTRGEIQGIGFDNNDRISSSRTFQLYGTQTWGIQAFDNYTDGDVGTWKSYVIPVGQYFTGSFNRLTFVNDHDGGARNAYGTFRNIRVYEGNDCAGLLPANREPIDPDGPAGIVEAESLEVFPNPATDELHLDVGMVQSATGVARVFDLTGRNVLTRSFNLASGTQVIDLDVAALPAGTYLLRFDGDRGFTATRKFHVAR